MYFTNCKNEQETKSAFRHLSKILHPDLGGTCDLFREMNEEYLKHLKSLNGTYNSKDDERAGKRQYHYNETVETDLMNMVRALQGLRMPETVEISINGSWIWVKGTLKNKFGHYPLNTQFIPQLERLGLKLHTMKGECYYRDPSNKVHTKGRVTTYDRINRRYAGLNFQNNGADQIN